MLRWPLAMCIIAVHWFTWGGVVSTVGLDSETAHLPVWAAFTGFVKAFLSENGVASFFFISGYLFFVGIDFSWAKYKIKVKKRINTLVIPYFIWNILTVAVLAAHYLPLFSNVFPRMHAEGFQMTCRDFFMGMLFTTSPHNPNLWFIRELMIFVLISPGIYLLLRKLPVSSLIGMFTASVLLLPLDSLYIQQFTWAILFFSVGALFAIKKCDLVRLAERYFKCALVMFFVCGILCWVTMSNYPYLSDVFKLLSLLPVIIVALDIAGKCVTKKNMQANIFLTGATFFVFVFHPLIISHLLMFLARVCKPQTDIAITMVYFVGYFLLIAITLGIYWTLMHLSPRLMSVLVGKRNKQPFKG